MNINKTIIGIVIFSLFLLGCSASSSNITHTKLIDTQSNKVIELEKKINLIETCLINYNNQTDLINCLEDDTNE